MKALLTVARSLLFSAAAAVGAVALLAIMPEKWTVTIIPRTVVEHPQNVGGKSTVSGRAVIGGTSAAGGISTLPAEFSITGSNATWANPNAAANIDPFSPYWPWPNMRFRRAVLVNSSANWSSMGEYPSETSGAGGTCSAQGTLAASATAPMQCQTGTSTTINTPAGISGGGGGNAALYRVGRTHGMMAQFGGSISTTASVRFFVGFSDQTLANQIAPGGGAGSDVAAGNYVGFMYSATGTYTGLTDTTNWVCVLKNGTTQDAISTSVAANTSFHQFALWEDITGAVWHFYLDNVEVCGTGTSVDAPASGTMVRYVFGLMNLAAVTDNLRTAWVMTESDL